MKRIIIVLTTLLIIILTSCTIEATTAKLNAPMGLRQLGNVDISSLTDYNVFNMNGTLETEIDDYDSSNNPYYAGDGYGTPSTMTNCVAIEFYAYNTEQNFNGYNVYIVTNDVAFTDAATTRSLIKAQLKLYQKGQNDSDVSNPIKPVEPGDVSSGSYASTLSNVYFSGGGLTRFVVVLNQECDYTTKVLNNFASNNSWIVVTAVSLTSDSLNESEPSNAIQISNP